MPLTARAAPRSRTDAGRADRSPHDPFTVGTRHLHTDLGRALRRLGQPLVRSTREGHVIWYIDWQDQERQHRQHPVPSQRQTCARRSPTARSRAPTRSRRSPPAPSTSRRPTTFQILFTGLSPSSAPTASTSRPTGRRTAPRPPPTSMRRCPTSRAKHHDRPTPGTTTGSRPASTEAPRSSATAESHGQPWLAPRPTPPPQPASLTAPQPTTNAGCEVCPACPTTPTPPPNRRR